MVLYLEWKAGLAGRGHFDHYDDLIARKMAERKREEDDKKMRMGDEEFWEWKAVRETEVVLW